MSDSYDIAEYASNEEANESAETMAEFQEAPFPEPDNDLKEAFAESISEPEQPVQQQPFQIFGEEQSF